MRKTGAKKSKKRQMQERFGELAHSGSGTRGVKFRLRFLPPRDRRKIEPNS